MSNQVSNSTKLLNMYVGFSGNNITLKFHGLANLEQSEYRILVIFLHTITYAKNEVRYALVM